MIELQQLSRWPKGAQVFRLDPHSEDQEGTQEVSAYKAFSG
jgi:hypothetical protein